MRARRERRGWSEALTTPKSPLTAVLRAAGGYVLLAVLATALAVALRDGVPWVHPDPWIAELSPRDGGVPLPLALGSSALLGLTVATGIITFTRVTVPRFAWAQRLHAELRPVARDLTVGQILVIAGLSSLGEELLFRGLLVPLAGVVPAAMLFGLAHQIKGPSRWVWTGWATAVGLLLGAVFALTGSLVGPLLAHAIVNAANLTYLRDHDPAY
jgi:membrane protease YdiL (CAAX protease family)